jgi:asparagine synthase (glutamine-hydrolysing)
MCGICGIVTLDPRESLPGPEIVQKMTAVLRHRGPDDEGFHLDSHAALGHRRLSIIDRSGGHQPIANEDGSRLIIFNGEIYNHREARSFLESRGHRYRTASDTESILHLMEEEGPEGLNRLNGMWAFAVWDRERRHLILARDRLGIKPLYYAQVGPRLLFASEIKSLLASGLVSREIDPVSLEAFLECQYVPGPRTIFKAVKKLPPAHALVADASGIRLERYWRPEFRLEPVPSFEEAAARLRELMFDSVRLRLLSEVPLGVFLSGGIDSSLVVGLMSRLMDQPVKTFTIGFRGEGWFDESPEAEAVARHFRTDHHTLTLESLDLPAYLEKAVVALDEPMADPASIPTYLISRYARQWVTVALTGEGADELFAGYDHYRFERILARLGPLSTLAGRTAGLLPSSLFTPRVRRVLAAAALPEPERHLRVRATLDAREVASLVCRPSSESPRATLEAVQEAEDQYRSRDPVNRLLFLDLATWLHDDLLMKVDKMSMLASLEARVPFLDYRVVEFLFSLPGSYKIRNGRSKALLRAALGDLIPARTRRRPKHGFALPIQRWLRGELSTFVRDIFASRDDFFYDHLDRRAVEGILDQFYRRKLDRSLPLWILLNLKIWCRQVLRPVIETSVSSR